MKNELYPGHRVRVRSYQEICGTLDSNGTLESLPFMPEMVPFCGREYRVFRRLEKICVEGFGARLLPNTVLLEGVRCDGSAHDGCQRLCPLLWKRAWLEEIEEKSHSESSAQPSSSVTTCPFKTRSDEGRYWCQSTQLNRATHYLFPLTIKRCTAEYCARNVDFRKAVEFVWNPLVVKLKTKLLGRRFVHPVGNSRRTPSEALGLQAGEWVEVKTPKEIAATVDQQGRNRGLSFTPDMLPFCGRRYAVKSRVDRAILEPTGEMHEFKNTVILDLVTCDGHSILGGCSRDVYHLWREIWLRRAPPPVSPGSSPGLPATERSI